MRLLIAYDGSDWSETALHNLRALGMPSHGEALLLHVDEHTQPDEAIVADLGASIARHLLPSGWTVRSSCMQGPVAESILRHAGQWRADLLYVGTHGHGGIHHSGLGSVAQELIQHAPCSVRVGRTRPHARHQSALRLMLAVDGSRDAEAAVQCIRSRTWLTGTRLRIACVGEARRPSGGESAPVVHSEQWAQEITHATARRFADTQLIADTAEYEGDPADVLLSAADRAGIDCVFLGATGQSGWRPAKVGSVTAQILLSAGCSVEVCRCLNGPQAAGHSKAAAGQTVRA